MSGRDDALKCGQALGALAEQVIIEVQAGERWPAPQVAVVQGITGGQDTLGMPWQEHGVVVD